MGAVAGPVCVAADVYLVDSQYLCTNRPDGGLFMRTPAEGSCAGAGVNVGVVMIVEVGAGMRTVVVVLFAGMVVVRVLVNATSVVVGREGMEDG
jgi:hypothetical protein